MPPRAVLVGLPGVGKSSVGAELAVRLAVPFADSDELVERDQARSVADIFADRGEAGFRELEAAAVGQALRAFPGVLALGGGAVTTERVRLELLASAVPVLLLTASRQELLDRIGSSTHRPLLAGDPAGRLAVLERDRLALYEQVCTDVVDTAGQPVSAVVDEVARRIGA